LHLRSKILTVNVQRHAEGRKFFTTSADRLLSGMTTCWYRKAYVMEILQEKSRMCMVKYFRRYKNTEN